MLKIIKGGFDSGLTDKIYSEILDRTLAGKRSILIVPEQQTLTAEAETVELLPPSSALCFEATNFTRFANSVLRTLGGIAGEYCTRDRRRLIMWKTLSELSPFLSLSGGGDISSGMIDRAMAAVAELDSHGITSEELAEAAASDAITKNARLSSKVEDLAKISSLYKKLILEKYQDAEDDLKEAGQKLLSSPSYLDGAVIYVEGFSSFTEPQYRLLSVLMRLTDVTVALAVPKTEGREYEFTELKDTESRLLGTADIAAVNKKMTVIDGRFSTHSELLSEAERLMFKSFGEVAEDCPSDGSLRIIEAETPYDEAAFVASDIRKRVATGASFSDFAIITRSMDSYRGIIDSALSDYAVPHYLSKRRSVDSFEAVKLIYTAYSAVSGGFSREAIMTYAKCGLTGLSDSELDELELYCETWQIDGRGFSEGLDWTMNPRGYTHKHQADVDALLRINAAREKLLSPLIDFSIKVKEAVTVRDHATALFSLLSRLDVEGTLASRAEDFKKIGETRAAEDTEKLFSVICNALDVIVSTLGDTECSADAFLVQLRTVFSECSIGSLPSYLDEVTVGSADMLRLRGMRHVYLIGVNAGSFPATVSEGNYFTDKDKETLGEAGLAFHADTTRRAAKELYIFRRAFAMANESVTLLYPRLSTRRASLSPAEVVGRLIALSGGRVKLEHTSELRPVDYIYTPITALARLGTLNEVDTETARCALSARGYERLARISKIPTVNDSLSVSPEVCERLFAGDLNLTQSRIDSYVGCPLAYFCKYELSLSSGEHAEWNAASIGTLVHAILENFFAEVKRRNLDLSELTDEDKKKMTATAAKKYLDALAGEGTLGGSRLAVTLARLERAALPVVDGLCRELSQSKYKPVFFELKIKNGVKGSPEPVVIDSGDRRVFVFGTIDRVDAFIDEGDVYVRVVDYKTGSKVFSPKDLAEGKNLQMFLYRRSIIDTENRDFKERLGAGAGSRILPGGVIYAHTSMADVTIQRDSDLLAREAISEKQKRSGMILDDEKSISAMSREHLPLTFDKKGEVKSTDRLYSLDEWKGISETVEESVKRVANGITSGDAAAPKKQGAQIACDWCDFKSICRNATK